MPYLYLELQHHQRSHLFTTCSFILCTVFNHITSPRGHTIRDFTEQGVGSLLLRQCERSTSTKQLPFSFNLSPVHQLILRVEIRFCLLSTAKITEKAFMDSCKRYCNLIVIFFFPALIYSAYFGFTLLFLSQFPKVETY